MASFAIFVFMTVFCLNLCGAQNADIFIPCQIDQVYHQHPELLQGQEKADIAWNELKSIKSSIKTKKPPSYEIIDIPIVFHILFNPSDNVLGVNPNALYSTYIDILKKLDLDFNKNNPDISTFPLWQDRLGNMKLTFFINKIEYVDVGTNSPWPDALDFNKIQSTAQGGHDPIDPTHTANIWYIHDVPPRFSGYAFLPMSQENYDLHGITLNLRFLVGIWSFTTLLTHEFGHFIGLYHIWGTFVSCDDDDLVDDTPNMAETYVTFRVPCGYNHSLNSCGDGQVGDEPDMWDNFMSYATTCQNMFTNGQVQRSRTSTGMIGLRETFYEYLLPENMADIEFINMFYFVDKDEDCMLNDIKKYKCKKHCELSLCVSYSQSVFVDVYQDIEIIIGHDTQCSSGYLKVDTVIVSNVYVCYKRMEQMKPLSDETIVDMDMKVTGCQVKLILITAGGDRIVKKVSLTQHGKYYYGLLDDDNMDNNDYSINSHKNNIAHFHLIHLLLSNLWAICVAILCITAVLFCYCFTSKSFKTTSNDTNIETDDV